MGLRRGLREREIARHCQVSHPLVIKMRRNLSGNGYQMDTRKARRGGALYEMKLRADAGAGESSVAPGRASSATDAVGIPVPPERAAVFASVADFREAYDLFARLAKVVDRIARSPAGEVYRKELVSGVENGQPVLCCPALRIALRKLQDAEPYCGYCPECQQRCPGSTDPRCRKCAGRGWITRPAFEACPDSYRLGITRRAS